MHVNSRIPKPVRPRRRSSIRHANLGGRDESTVVAALPNVESRRTQTSDGKVRVFDAADHVPASQPTLMAEPVPKVRSGKDWFRMTVGVLVSLLLLYIAFQSLAQFGKSAARTVDYVPMQQTPSGDLNETILTQNRETTVVAPPGMAGINSIKKRTESSPDNTLTFSREETGTTLDAMPTLETSLEPSEASALDSAPLAFGEASDLNDALDVPDANAISELLEYPVTGFPTPGIDPVETMIEIERQLEPLAPRLAQLPNHSPTRSFEEPDVEQTTPDSELTLRSGDLNLPSPKQIDEQTPIVPEAVPAPTNADSWTQGETKLQGTIEKFPTNQ